MNRVRSNANELYAALKWNPILRPRDRSNKNDHGRNGNFPHGSILLSLLVGIASIWSSNKEVLGLFHDDGIYAVVAKSLSDGTGYRIISLPTAPDQTKYPFVYSYVLSWLWRLYPKFPDNIGLLKAANAVFLAAILVLSYLFYRRRVTGEESGGSVICSIGLYQSGCVFFYRFYGERHLVSFAFSLCFGDFRCLGAMHCAARKCHTIGSYSRSRLSDSISSDTPSSGRSRSFHMEQALSRFDALRMPSGSIYCPLVAMGQNAIQIKRRARCFTIMFPTVRSPPRL